MNCIAIIQNIDVGQGELRNFNFVSALLIIAKCSVFDFHKVGLYVFTERLKKTT